MKKPFMRKRVKQMPHVSGVKLGLKDNVDPLMRVKQTAVRQKATENEILIE